MKRVVVLILVVIPILFFLGCGTTEVVTDERLVDRQVARPTPTPPPQRVVRSAPEEPVISTSIEPVATPRPIVDPLNDPSSLLAKRKIYFDFNESELRGDFRDILTAHASYLTDHPELRITIEGHADERGTREYNLALGERRANAVEQILTLQGARVNQIRLVSFGEERAEVEGHDEFAWEMNRRAIIVYP